MSLISLQVDGAQVTIDTDAELEIGELGEDMNAVAAQMAFWGNIWASAEAERIKTEAYYRSWSANKKMAITNANPKLAEWRVSQEIQAMPEYMKLYSAQAEATKNSILAKSIFDSYRTKASMLQSRGAMMRAELDSTGINTPAQVSERSANQKEKEREMIAKMKSTFKGKKAKKEV